MKQTYNSNLTKQQLELVQSIGLKEGDTVYTVLHHVSSSGMTRAIGLRKVDKDGSIIQLDYLAAKLKLGNFNKKHGGITCQGCGMDMGFDLVYRLSRTVFDSSNKDSGYSLKQRWI